MMKEHSYVATVLKWLISLPCVGVVCWLIIKFSSFISHLTVWTFKNIISDVFHKVTTLITIKLSFFEMS